MHLFTAESTPSLQLGASLSEATPTQAGGPLSPHFMNGQMEARKRAGLPRSCSLAVAQPRPELRFVCPRAGTPAPLPLPLASLAHGSSSYAQGQEPCAAPCPLLSHVLKEEMHWEREEAKKFRSKRLAGIPKVQTTCFLRCGGPASPVRAGASHLRVPPREEHRLWSQIDAAPELKLPGALFPHL